MYEHRHEALLPIAAFVRRLLVHLATALGLILGSLAGGMAGYVHFEKLSWIDAFLNVTMLLGGMGPVNPPQTDGGKLFAGCFALYAGLVFVAVTALMLSPVVHRVMHRFHWNEERDAS
ncbi:MAG TPA: hypothetical protein VN634_11895 [Candidatus Limnocylindrales bacterium]|nr:hypothetical protein [Candidatus Limnocylindrales bacterium]